MFKVDFMKPDIRILNKNLVSYLLLIYLLQNKKKHNEDFLC